MSSGEDKSAREFLESLHQGQVCRGPVSAVTDFGVFVDLGVTKGIITVPNLSWRHFSHPSEVVGVGDEVTVCVLSVDLDREQASLSLKELQPDPFLDFARTRFSRNIAGTVAKIAPIGIFVQLEGDIEGLLPASEFEAQRKEMEIGAPLTVRVDYVNTATRRIMVSRTDSQS
ncbi:S1 RNA-binding domain-containing protein [Streptomyces sp. NPDC047525]|uniref:S1 RNA-binding domain-containing protein n=1 Tax=Streptomyces sp. NPDC047525 TaxID=3155264 RepID=UPI003401B859